MRYVQYWGEESYCNLVLRKWQEAGGLQLSCIERRCSCLKLQCAGGAIFRSKKLPPWVPRQARWHGLLSYTFLTFCECVKAMSHVKHLSSQFASSSYVSAEPEFPTLVGVEVQRNFNAYPSLTHVNGRILAWPLQVGGRASKHSFHPFHPVLVDFVSSKAQTSKEIL